MIARIEPWGAWVKVDSPAAIVALDRDGARTLGLEGGARWHDDVGVPPAPSPPLEVHLAVTSRCGAGCTGCYLDARPDGHEPPARTVLAQLDAMRDAGVFTVAFGGGEPTTRVDLESLAEAARARGITPVLTTSGIGLSSSKVARLRSFAQVNVSYDGDAAVYTDVRGFDGADAAESAIRTLVAAGVRVGVNVVLTRMTFGALRDTLLRARALGASEAQLLRYKPAGRAASLDYLARRLTRAQGASLGATLRALSTELAAGEAPFGLRIDCALVPFLSADDELAARPDALARFGIFGCEAGGALAAVRIDGRVAPCSFAEPSDLAAADLATGYGDDATLARFRDFSTAPPEPCASCTLRSVCKGGCKVVATYVDGAFGADPECPRVVAARDAAATEQAPP